MFTKRQIKILELILKNTNGIKGTEISEKVNVTTRTIRNDIVSINNSLKFEHLKIHSSNKKGYYVEAENVDKIKNLITSTKGFNNDLQQENRFFIIMGKILFTDKMHFFDLAECLYVSEQTVYKEVEKIKYVLKSKYKVDFLKVASNYIWVEASEFDIREVIFKILKESLVSDQEECINKMQVFLNSKFDATEYKMLYRNIKKYFSYKNIMVNDKSLVMITASIYITIIRNRYGYCITDEKFEKTKSEEVIEDLINNLIDVGIKISDLDKPCLYKFLWSIKLNESKNLISKISVSAMSILNEFCSEVMNNYNIDLKESDEIIHYLETHMEYMVRRLDTNYELDNPIINDIKKKYPFSYEIAMLIVHIIYKYKNRYPSDDEISYIAIYVENFLEKFNKKLKTVIVSDKSMCINNIIVNWLKNNFYNQIDVIGYESLHSIEDYLSKNKVDMLITTVKMTINSDIPYYMIDRIPEPSDYYLINNIIHKIKMSYKFENIIKKMFNSKFIHIFDKEHTFEDIITYMAEQLYKENIINDLDVYVDDVLQREINYPTNIGKHLMIPHPIVSFANKSTVGVAVLKKPLIHNGMEIKLIFLLAMENKIDDDVSALFQLIKQFALNKEYLNDLIKIEDKNNFVDKLINLSRIIQ